MKKLTISSFPSQLWAAVLRFPVATLCCAALFVIDMLAINRWHEYDTDILVKLNMLLPLGFVLAVGVQIVAADFARRCWQRYADVLVLPLLALYFFLLPDNMGNLDYTESIINYYTIFCLVALILLGVAPLASARQPLAFWQYNIKIWWGALFASICAGIFWCGCALAFLAVQSLFDLDTSEKTFAYLAIFFTTLFAPLFFIMSVPAQHSAEEPKRYAAPRIIGQYILLPLNIIYLLILYAYAIKIIITWQLPEGWVSWLVLAYLSVGLLVFFLQHNLYVTRTSRIARISGKGFLYSALPLVALLLVAVLRRVSDYGITENRYYLLLFAAWFTGIVLYLIISHGKSFRPVLFSLAAGALLSVAGPWSVFSVSNCSQRSRLEKCLERNNLLQDGKYTQYLDSSRLVSQFVASDDYDAMKSIVRYFAKKRNLSYIQPLFTADLEALHSEYSTWSMDDRLFNNMLVKEDAREDVVIDVETIETETTEAAAYRNYELEAADKNNIPLGGYDRLLSYTYNSWNTDEELSSQATTTAYVIVAQNRDILTVYNYGDLHTIMNLRALVEQLLPVLKQKYNDDESLTIDDMSLAIDANHKVIFTTIEGYETGNVFELRTAELYFLIKE
jgi:hypothetical protein